MNADATNLPPNPPDPLPEVADVPENASAGRRVVRVTFTDPENERLTYSLDSDESAIVPSTGQITVKQGAAFDYEHTPSYSVTVSAADPFGVDATATLTIGISDVNEPPAAADDAPPPFLEDTSVTIDVLANDSDPEDDRSALTVSIQRGGPANGSVVVNDPVNPGDRPTITYTPGANYNGSDSFAYQARDPGGLPSGEATVALTIDEVNDAPVFAPATAERRVSESAAEGDDVGAPVTATDVDGDELTYSLSGTDAFAFDINEDGQITVVRRGYHVRHRDEGHVHRHRRPPPTGLPRRLSATIEVTITVTTGPVTPPVIFTGGGGGGCIGTHPERCRLRVDREARHRRTRQRSQQALGPLVRRHDALDPRERRRRRRRRLRLRPRHRRARRGPRVRARPDQPRTARRLVRSHDSSGSPTAVSNSLFAHNFESGERLPERDIALAARNRAARGIWSGDETMWVLDGGKDALFAYDLASGELLAEYELVSANGDPHGLWSDGVTVWVSDHGAKRLFAYRLPVPDAEEVDGEDIELERVRDEEFPNTILSRASNNSPRGLWSDGDVMYVVDASDGKVYTYNMPDAIDARLVFTHAQRRGHRRIRSPNRDGVRGRRGRTASP